MKEHDTMVDKFFILAFIVVVFGFGSMWVQFYITTEYLRVGLKSAKADYIQAICRAEEQNK